MGGAFIDDGTSSTLLNSITLWNGTEFLPLGNCLCGSGGPGSGQNPSVSQVIGYNNNIVVTGNFYGYFNNSSYTTATQCINLSTWIE